MSAVMTTAYDKQMEGLCKRIADLEALALDMAEHTRRARWHATRDAVLPAIYAESMQHGMTVAEVLSDAAAFADRAHGPLES